MREREREEARLGEERKRRKNETRRNRARERKSGDGSTVIRVTNFPLTPFASLCSTVWTRLIINTHIRFWKTRLGVSGWETFFFFLNPPHNGYLLFLAVSKLELLLLSKTSFSMFSPSDSWIFFFDNRFDWFPGRWFLVSREMLGGGGRILILHESWTLNV